MTYLIVKKTNVHKKNLQFFIVQGSLNQNTTFLGEKLCSVTWNKKNYKILVLYKENIEKCL